MSNHSMNFTQNGNGSPRRTPPEHKGWPGVGAIPELLKKEVSFVNELRRKYGEVYKLDLGVLKVVVLNHPEHAQHVLIDKVHRYPKNGKFWDFTREFVGATLPVIEGDLWRSHRRMLQPHFHLQSLRVLMDRLLEAIDEDIGRWVALGDQPIDLASAINATTLKVILKALFGNVVDEETVDKAARALQRTSGGVGRSRYLLRRVLAWSVRALIPLPDAPHARAMRHEVDRLLYEMIALHRERPSGEYTLFSMLLNVVDEKTDARLTDQEICDEAITVFGAGYETTASSLASAMHLLMQHPDKMASLRAEIDAVLGDERPTFETLKQMPYTSMVLQETMRMYPPAWFMPRTASEDDIIDGYSIPAGTAVMLPIYAYHHHPDFWDNPEAFDPERFSPERSAGRHRLAWMPFGAGQRLCIGKDLAMMSGKLILARMMQEYDFTPVHGRAFAQTFAVVRKPKDGVWCRVTPRRGR